ncbi:MAG: alpha/beta hydrolase [Sandaracinus sp.]|nr:alpha/beta hydrolase [Sandaracinus sp.]MCB9613852.1 alpha/beta hydrolase [Sandaracinus sp.]MCB9621297.1 alpha/beta hydrolase [Sandaracinus sp.]MCB9623175.1 alpha/beta hydrolase [Sandaracinus sp.]MCB9636390.1 alpha/beta hydrolase [Sandaracinus sp.]
MSRARRKIPDMAELHDASGVTSRDPALRWWTAGSRGPRILFVMGFGMRGDVWRPQIEGLRSDHRVAWFDHRGVGESPRGDRRVWTMKDMADDAVGVLDALGWDDAHLVGVSMGGMVAQEIALRFEPRLRSLTLIATHEGGRLPAKLPTWVGMRQFVRANTSRGPARLEAMKTLLYPPEFAGRFDPATLGERMAAQFGRPVAKETLVGQLSAVLRHDTGDRLGRLTLPTLIVKPCKDVLIKPSSSDRLRRRIAHARLLELADAGHGVTFQCAAEVNEGIRRHVNDAEMTSLARRGSSVHA